MIRNESFIIDEVEDVRIDDHRTDTLLFHEGGEEELATLISETRLVPLEIREECVIGKIAKIICNKENIYIQNQIEGRNSVMMFDQRGKYRAKIEKNGRGPGEYIKLGDFDVDTEGNIYVLDWMRSDRILVYDSNFDFVRQIKLDVSAVVFTVFDKMIWVYAGRRGYQNEEKYLIYKLNDTGKICEKYFPFKHTLKGEFSHNNIFVKAGNELYLNIPFTNIIYSVRGNDIEAVYSLEYYQEGFDENCFDVCEFKRFYPLRQKIFVQTPRFAERGEKYRSFMLGCFDKVSKNSVAADTWRIKDAPAAGKLLYPLGSQVCGIWNDSVLVHPMECIILLERYKKNVANYKKLPDMQRKIIDGLTEEDNPVLFFNAIQNH